MELTMYNVRKVFIECLRNPIENYKYGKKFNPNNYIKIEGVFNEFILVGYGLFMNCENIISMLDQLSPVFKVIKSTDGDTWSFDHMIFKGENESNIIKWGENYNAQELLVLGLGLGVIKYLDSNREAWKDMPGGVPYIVYNPNGFKNK